MRHYPTVAPSIRSIRDEPILNAIVYPISFYRFMTPRDHNRTLGIIHGLLGALVLVGLAVGAVSELRRRPTDAAERVRWMLYMLPLPLLQFLTAYGVLTLRRWGRILALLFSVLYVWVFPFGTLLAVYTWWFFYGEAGQRFYNCTAPVEQREL